MTDALGLSGLVISANLFLARTMGRVTVWLTLLAIGMVLVLIYKRYRKKKY